MCKTSKAECFVVHDTLRRFMNLLCANHASVSQFTLLAKTTKGSKPDFHGAMGGEEASRLYHYFLKKVQDGYVADRVKNGKFQAMMEVALVNDGPVCFNNPPSRLVNYSC